MAKTSSTHRIEDLTYEAAFSELQEIVTSLEGQPASLDQAMALYERGQALARRCAQLLDRAEMKVKRLSGTQLVDPEEE